MKATSASSPPLSGGLGRRAGSCRASPAPKQAKNVPDAERAFAARKVGVGALGALRLVFRVRSDAMGQEERCDLTARRSAIEGFYLPQVF